MARIEQADPRTSFGRVVTGSLICRAVTAAVRRAIGGGRQAFAGARRLDAALGHVPMPRPDPADEERVKALLASSRLVAWIEAALDIPDRAWKSSALRRLIQPSIDRVGSLTAAERLRLLGWVLLVAAVTHIGLELAFAEPVGWATWLAWWAFLIAAGVMARWPSEVIAAWIDSRLRRRLRRGGR